jgi:predicted extracellular nuclease
MTKFNVFSMMLGLAIAGPALASGVFFSEYIEGSSSNKALEIYNGSGSVLDLSTVQVKRAANGGATYTTIQPTGMLSPGCTYVIANPGSNSTILGLAQMTSATISFNGDDYMGLFINSVLVDQIGVYNVTPLVIWSVYDSSDTVIGATAEYTLRRSAAVTDGSIVWFGQGDHQWDVFPQNDSANLGIHGTIPCGGNINPDVAACHHQPRRPHRG